MSQERDEYLLNVEKYATGGCTNLLIPSLSYLYINERYSLYNLNIILLYSEIFTIISSTVKNFWWICYSKFWIYKSIYHVKNPNNSNNT